MFARRVATLLVTAMIMTLTTDAMQGSQVSALGHTATVLHARQKLSVHRV